MQQFIGVCRTKLASVCGYTFDVTHVTCHLCWTILCALCINFTVGLELRGQSPALTEVPPGLPTDIVELDMGNNEITGIGADSFTGLSSVVEIKLDYNNISYIDEVALLPCLSLLRLELSFNKLTSLPTTLGPNSPNLIYLSIGYNPCTIEVNWFSQFRSLQTLDMRKSGMTDPPNDLFNGLSNLKKLKLENMKPPNLTERTVSLEILQYSDHIGSIIPDENFRNLKYLKEVSMQRSKPEMTTSVPRFLDSPALEILKYNFFCEILPDISHLPQLKDLEYFFFGVICDHRLCWTLFESFNFTLPGLGGASRGPSGCFRPPEFQGRIIFSISKLELGCYDSKRHCPWWS